MNDITKAYGRRLAQARTAKGLTQTELGKSIGVTRSAIASIEGGRTTHSVVQAATIAGLLDVSVDWLVTGKTAEPPVEMEMHLSRIRTGWQRIVEGNTGMGWPPQALCVSQPSAFIKQLDAILDGTALDRVPPPRRHRESSRPAETVS